MPPVFPRSKLMGYRVSKSSGIYLCICIAIPMALLLMLNQPRPIASGESVCMPEYPYVLLLISLVPSQI